MADTEKETAEKAAADKAAADKAAKANKKPEVRTMKVVLRSHLDAPIEGEIQRIAPGIRELPEALAQEAIALGIAEDPAAEAEDEA